MNFSEITFDTVIIMSMIGFLSSLMFNFINMKRQERAERGKESSAKCKECIEKEVLKKEVEHLQKSLDDIKFSLEDLRKEIQSFREFRVALETDKITTK